jgi:hypothetical protein
VVVFIVVKLEFAFIVLGDYSYNIKPLRGVLKVLYLHILGVKTGTLLI